MGLGLTALPFWRPFAQTRKNNRVTWCELCGAERSLNECQRMPGVIFPKNAAGVRSTTSFQKIVWDKVSKALPGTSQLLPPATAHLQPALLYTDSARHGS